MSQLYFANIDRTDSFISDCEKLRPLSRAEATGLLAVMRALDGQQNGVDASKLIQNSV